MMITFLVPLATLATSHGYGLSGPEVEAAPRTRRGDGAGPKEGNYDGAGPKEGNYDGAGPKDLNYDKPPPCPNGMRRTDAGCVKCSEGYSCLKSSVKGGVGWEFDPGMCVLGASCLKNKCEKGSITNCSTAGLCTDGYDLVDYKCTLPPGQSQIEAIMKTQGESITMDTTGKFSFPEEFENKPNTSDIDTAARRRYNHGVYEKVQEVMNNRSEAKATVPAATLFMPEDFLQKAQEMQEQVIEDPVALSGGGGAPAGTITVIVVAPSDDEYILPAKETWSPVLFINEVAKIRDPCGRAVVLSADNLTVNDIDYGDNIPDCNYEFEGSEFTLHTIRGSAGFVSTLQSTPCPLAGAYERIGEGQRPSDHNCTWTKICHTGRGACSGGAGFDWCDFGAPEYRDAPKRDPGGQGCEKGTIHMVDDVCYTC